jgi:uncharacterized protein YdhG (YjbR/CyaY superfamily)
MSTGKSTTKKATGFTEAEKAAMKARAQELKAEERNSKDREEGEKQVLAAIAGLKEPDRSIAGRLHEIVKATAPSLMPKTWYGFPAYAKDGKIICFYQYAEKFKTRYSELGFNDAAKLDDGNMWPVRYALKAMTPAEEARIVALIKKAVG